MAVEQGPGSPRYNQDGRATEVCACLFIVSVQGPCGGRGRQVRWYPPSNLSPLCLSLLSSPASHPSSVLLNLLLPHPAPSGSLLQPLPSKPILGWDGEEGGHEDIFQAPTLHLSLLRLPSVSDPGWGCPQSSVLTLKIPTPSLVPSL